jgi:hypothetical protein
MYVITHIAMVFIIHNHIDITIIIMYQYQEHMIMMDIITDIYQASLLQIHIIMATISQASLHRSLHLITDLRILVAQDQHQDQIHRIGDKIQNNNYYFVKKL